MTVGFPNRAFLALYGGLACGLALSGCLSPSAVTTTGSISSSTSGSTSSSLAAPSQLLVASITGPSITLSWTDNATTETGYQIQSCSGANCTGFTAVSASPLAADSATHTEAGLANGTVYRFRIRAVTDSKNSSWLTSGNLTTPTVPTAPAGLAARFGRTGVTLSWTAVSGATSYDVEQCTASACVYAAVTGSPLAAPAATIDITDLVASTGYIFRVRANNAVGAGNYSTTPTTTTLAAMTAAVTAASTSSVTDTSMVLSWSGGATGSVGYAVETCDSGCVTCAAPTTVAQANPATTSLSIGSLTTGTAYCFKITSFQGPDLDDRNGAFVSADTTTLLTPDPPTAFSVTAQTAKTATLSWTEPAANVPASYDIETIASSTCSSFTGATVTNDAALGASMANSVTISNLTPNTDYCFRIRSKATGNYYSAYVNTAAVPSTTTQTVPTAPGEFYVSAISATGIELKWQDRSTDENHTEVARCDAATSSASCTTFTTLTSGTCENDNAPMNGANATRCLDTDGITAGEYYYYRVRAVNGATDRESDWVTLSNPVTPKADAPPMGVDGTVYAMARAGDTIYVGGDFDYAGPVTGPAVRMLSGSTTVTVGNVVFRDTNATTPQINTIISDGNSGYYIGGSFTHAGSTALVNLAHILSDGSLDSAWTIGATGGEVRALALAGTRLVVGGSFAALAGNGAFVRLGSIDVSTATPSLDTTWDPNADGDVYSLLASGSAVYVGGNFTTIGGRAAERIAYSSAATGTATTTFTTFCDTPVGANGIVRAIALNGTNVVIGGDFTTINGAARTYIGEVDNTCVITVWNPSANASVRALVANGSNLYVGGSFTTLGGSSRNYFGALSLGTGIAQSINPNPNAAVYGLSLHGTTLYVAGAFTTLGGASRYRVGNLSISTGALGAWAPFLNNTAHSVHASAAGIYTGGIFTLGGASPRTNLAAFSASTGILSSTFAPNPDGNVTALHAGSSRLFVGGEFSTIGGSSRSYFASLSSVGTVDTSAPTANGFVNALESVGGNLYLGGSFTQVTLSSTTSTRQRLAAFSLANWALQAWDPTANGTVRTLEAMEDLPTPMLLVGGAFSQAAGLTQNYLVKIDTSTGLGVAAFAPAITGTTLRTIAYNPGANVYIGGNFTSDGSGNGYYAVLNSTTGVATGAASSANGEVHSLQIDQARTKLYIGGAFTTVVGAGRDGFAQILLATHADNGLNFDPSAGSATYAVCPSPSAVSVYFGGTFSVIEESTEADPAPKLGAVHTVTGDTL